jgi:hypothetical protein
LKEGKALGSEKGQDVDFLRKPVSSFKYYLTIKFLPHRKQNTIVFIVVSFYMLARDCITV